MAVNSECLEVIVGTYEEFLIGYKLQKQPSGSYELQQSFTNHAHTGSVRCVSAGKRAFLASGSTDETVRLFNMKKRTECGSLVQHDGTITCLEFYGDSYLLSGSEDGTVCVWSARNWQCLKTLRGHKGGVTSISVHPSGKLLLSVSKDKTLKTWNLVKGRSAYTINLKAVSEIVRWFPSGEQFLVGINDRVDVYRVDVGGVVQSIDFGKRVATVVFLKHNLIAVGGEKEDLEIHNLEQKCVTTLPSAHKNRIKELVCCKTSNGAKQFLFSVSSDHWLKVWEFDSDLALVLPDPVAEIDTTCRPTCLAVSGGISTRGEPSLEVDPPRTDNVKKRKRK